jgi:hypothetical protein
MKAARENTIVGVYIMIQLFDFLILLFALLSLRTS